MQRGVYAAAAGMVASEQWLDVIANNLANASTTGFKRDEVTFNEGYSRLVMGEGGHGNPLGELGAGPAYIASHTIWENGSFLSTGNPLDVAIRGGRGLFAVQTPGGVAYTRSGSFSLNSNKELVTKDGQLVLDAGGAPIRFPADQPNARILDNGTVMAGDQTIARLATWDGQATKIGANLYSLQNPAVNTQPDLVSGAVEASNVNPIEEMINMIKLHRVFELAQKSAASQDDATSGLIQSMSK